jgi:hypothetical protein
LIELRYALGDSRLCSDMPPRVDRVDDVRDRIASNHAATGDAEAGG